MSKMCIRDSNQKDADGNRIKYYSEGDLVTTLTTGKDGKATAKNLSLIHI